jgi:hypothetical protein
MSRAHKITLIVFLVGFLLPSGIGFAEKLYLFYRTIRHSDEGSFAIVPVLNYLIVFAGMACLLVWAIANGMFADIEGPKYTMLENERRLDEQSGASWD